MNYKLEYKHEVTNRDETAYAAGELKKARETIKELCKDKDKYKDKIRVLAQHIQNLREITIQETFSGTLTKIKSGHGRQFNTHRFFRLHVVILETKCMLVEQVKEQRRLNKVKPMKANIFGIKRYMKMGSEKKGFVYPKAGTILELLKSKKIKTIKDAKKPFSKENHIGVEIEFASFLTEEQIGQLFLDAGLLDNVQLAHEYIQGRDNGEKEYELCIVAHENKICDIIERVCIVLNEKIDANITFGCGLHVHIDARNREIKRMFDNLFNCQEILYNMVAHTRRHNRHVQIMEDKRWYPVNGGFRHTTKCKDEKCFCEFENKDAIKRAANRFYGLNTWSNKTHNTMEVRIHSGTSNAAKINNWIKLLVAIVDGKPIKTYLKSLEEFKSVVKLDNKLLEYVEKRIEYFKQDLA